MTRLGPVLSGSAKLAQPKARLAALPPSPSLPYEGGGCRFGPPRAEEANSCAD